MKGFFLVVTIFLLLPILMVSLLLTSAEYVQCEDLEPDEWLDFAGTIEEPIVDFADITAHLIDNLRPELPGLLRISPSRFHSFDRFSTQATLFEANLSPVMLI